MLAKIFYKLKLYHFKVLTTLLGLKYGIKFNVHLLQFGKGFTLEVKGNKWCFIANSIRFKNYCTVVIQETGNLNVGKNVFFNSHSSINCLNGITIGSNSIFGENVKLYDHNHKFRIEETPIAQQGYKTAPIKIGKNCWVGSNVVILKGITIGDNAIIGAGVVVANDIPENSITKIDSKKTYITQRIIR